MWTSTKTIATEIKSEQESLKNSIEEIRAQQQEEFAEIKNLLAMLSSGISNIEDRLTKNQTTYDSEILAVENRLQELKAQISESESNVKNVSHNNMVSIRDEMNRGFDCQVSSLKELSDTVKKDKTELQSDCHDLKEDLEKMKVFVKTSTDHISDLLMERSQNHTSELIENSHILQEAIDSRFADTIKIIEHGNSTAESKLEEAFSSVHASVGQYSDAFSEDIGGIKENIEVMSNGMQEILRNLMSLDEGSRLIIAKLLLKDMEI